MEEVTMAAGALYESFSAAERRNIQSLFRSVDRNGDGRISMQEFLSYTQNAGGYMRALFILVDHNRDGFLQFNELFTLFYIRASGRPTCGGCGILILGMYFTCTRCRLTNHFRHHSFDLCLPCFRNRRFVHPHSEFDDNYTLLLKMQTMLLRAPQACATLAYGHPSSSSRLVRDLVKAAFEGMVKGMIRSLQS